MAYNFRNAQRYINKYWNLFVFIQTCSPNTEIRIRLQNIEPSSFITTLRQTILWIRRGYQQYELPLTKEDLLEWWDKHTVKEGVYRGELFVVIDTTVKDSIYTTTFCNIEGFKDFKLISSAEGVNVDESDALLKVASGLTPIEYREDVFLACCLLRQQKIINQIIRFRNATLADLPPHDHFHEILVVEDEGLIVIV